MRRVALAMSLSDYYDHGVARGIVRYAKEQSDWQLHGHGWMFTPLADIRDWRGDGIIARAEFPEAWSVLREFSGSVVDVAHAFDSPCIQTVSNDDRRTGELASQHFAERDLENRAYCGASGTIWSQQRLEGFVGFEDDARVPSFDRPLRWWLDLTAEDELSAFLKVLPKPVGVFAANDKVALRVSGACRATGISIPEELAIIGTDNEDIPCELSNPPLTSIELGLESIGYRAAQELHRLLDGDGQPVTPIVVDPIEIIERQSTHTLAGTTPLAGRAYAAVRSPRGHLLTVEQLARNLSVSRRTLETKVKQATGRTVHEVLIEQRVRAAKHLLRNTSQKIETVAGIAGFGSLQRFYYHFRAATDQTPSEFRAAREWPTWPHQSR